LRETSRFEFNLIFRGGNVRFIKKLGLKIVDFNNPPYYSSHKKQWTFKYLNNYYIVLTDKLKYTQARKIVSALIEYEEKKNKEGEPVCPFCSQKIWFYTADYCCPLGDYKMAMCNCCTIYSIDHRHIKEE